MKIERTLIAALGSLVFSNAALAEIPAVYDPIVVEAPFSLKERTFDLSDPMAKAKAMGKPTYVYLGASDCGPCREYTRFLEKNRPQLQPAFDRVVVVDIRTWLKGPPISIKIGDKRYSLAEFKTLVGDRDGPLLYPSRWLLRPELTQVRQLPRELAPYLSVSAHEALLALP